MMGTNIRCLHENEHLTDQCIDLLNEQWPRSRIARLRSLAPGPPDSFPISLLLTTNDNGKESVIGHSKLLPMPQDKEACFVASVVVQKNLRGKGLGRLLMEGTEDFARAKGIKFIYLSTHDKQDFYRRLGYQLYEYSPVVLFGSGMLKLFATVEEDNASIPGIKGDSESESQLSLTPNKSPSKDSGIKPVFSNTCKPPPPPPPPPPKNTITVLSNASSGTDNKVHMKKVL